MSTNLTVKDWVADSIIPHTIRFTVTYDYERTADGMRWKFHINGKLLSGQCRSQILLWIRVNNPDESYYYWDVDEINFKSKDGSWGGTAGITYDSPWIEKEGAFSAASTTCTIRFENPVDISTWIADEWATPCYIEGNVNIISNKSSLTFYGYPTIGQQHHVRITSALAAYSHRLTFELNGYSQTLNIAGGNVITDGYWTPNIDGFARASPDSNRPELTWTLEVIYNNEVIGYTTGTTYLYVSHTSINPTTTISVADTSHHLQRYGYYLLGYSEIGISLTSSAKYNASIESELVYVGTEELVPPDSIIIPKGFLGNLEAVVKDSRGASTSALKALTVRAYTEPTVKKNADDTLLFSVHRCNAGGVADDTGEYCRVDFTVQYDKLEASGSSAGRNSHRLFVQWQSNSGSISGQQEISVTSYEFTGSYIFAADIEHSFTVSLEMWDDIRDSSNPVIRSIQLSTANVIMDWKVGGKGVGIGKVSEHNNALDINPDWDVNMGDLSHLKFNGVPLKRPQSVVIKEGESGIWHYKMWEDGTAELDGVQKLTVTTSNLLNGWYLNRYHSFDYNSIPFPTFEYDPDIDDIVPIDAYIVGQSSTSDPRQPSNWLSLTVGGAPLTPVTGRLYRVKTDGVFKNKVYGFGVTYYTPYQRNMFYETPSCIMQSAGDNDSRNNVPSLLFMKAPASYMETANFSIGTSTAVSNAVFTVSFHCVGRWKD